MSISELSVFRPIAAAPATQPEQAAAPSATPITLDELTLIFVRDKPTVAELPASARLKMSCKLCKNALFAIGGFSQRTRKFSLRSFLCGRLIAAGMSPPDVHRVFELMQNIHDKEAGPKAIQRFWNYSQLTRQET